MLFLIFISLKASFPTKCLDSDGTSLNVMAFKMTLATSIEDDPFLKEITFHSFRQFVKSTISDLGYGDYSEWFIGHSGSTYYRKTDKEKAEIFAKIEP